MRRRGLRVVRVNVYTLRSLNDAELDSLLQRLERQVKDMSISTMALGRKLFGPIPGSLDRCAVGAGPAMQRLGSPPNLNRAALTTARFDDPQPFFHFHFLARHEH
jgi:hypothetical protein